MTRLKLFTARVIYRCVTLVVRGDRHRIRRRGINYEVDLSEGIDLSLFAFGRFQSDVTDTRHFPLPTDAVVFDIGANIGTMALEFARRAPHGFVYAFEPAAYAYQKFLKNLSLNAELAARIKPIQAFVSDKASANHSVEIYSSWKIDGSAAATHPIHGGVIQAAQSVEVVTIDDFCRAEQITRVDLIKIDTDGHELQVLQGAERTLEQYLPYIIFEAGLYLMEEKGESFEQYFDYLSAFGYELLNNSNGHQITRENYFREIPLRSTTDIVAIPHRLAASGSPVELEGNVPTAITR